MNFEDEERLYFIDKIEDRIKYLKDNNMLNVKGNIVDVTDDYYHSIYILLDNGDLYIDGNKKYENIGRIHFQSATSLFAISNDNKVINLHDGEMDSYMANEGIAYKKVISTVLSLVCLTEEETIRFVSSVPDTCVDYNNLVNIVDIDYIIEDDEVVISHDGREYKKLFIG